MIAAGGDNELLFFWGQGLAEIIGSPGHNRTVGPEGQTVESARCHGHESGTFRGIRLSVGIIPPCVDRTVRTQTECVVPPCGDGDKMLAANLTKSGRAIRAPGYHKATRRNHTLIQRAGYHLRMEELADVLRINSEQRLGAIFERWTRGDDGCFLGISLRRWACSA